MTPIIAIAVVLVAAAGTAVVLTHQPRQQAVSLAMFGLMLSVLFLALQAPDVALSELGINALVVPLLILLTAAKTQGPRE
jgi:energy-converting hydrogenase B subunit D